MLLSNKEVPLPSNKQTQQQPPQRGGSSKLLPLKLSQTFAAVGPHANCTQVGAGDPG
eukprot:COSAG01_NODE_7332_length_3247_cov_2.094663_3_plen_57_part_00